MFYQVDLDDLEKQVPNNRTRFIDLAESEKQKYINKNTYDNTPDYSQLANVVVLPDQQPKSSIVNKIEPLFKNGGGKTKSKRSNKTKRSKRRSNKTRKSKA